MRKTVSNVLASARVLIKSPSTQDLPDEVLRLQLHTALDELTVFALNEKPDFLTNESALNLSYDSDVIGYAFDIEVDDSVKDIHIVKLFYQPVGQDPNIDSWEEARFVKYKNYPQASQEDRVVGCMFGNNYDGLVGKRIRINRNEDWVSQHRFRAGFRVVLGEILKYDENVPFPDEHISLLEYAIACEAINIVNDVSPDWTAFVARQKPNLESKLMEKKMQFAAWLRDDIDSVTVVTARPFNYKYRNQLRGNNHRRYRIERS